MPKLAVTRFLRQFYQKTISFNELKLRKIAIRRDKIISVDSFCPPNFRRVTNEELCSTTTSFRIRDLTIYCHTQQSGSEKTGSCYHVSFYERGGLRVGMVLSFYALLSSEEAFVAVKEFQITNALSSCFSLRAATLGLELRDIRTCWGYFYLGPKCDDILVTVDGIIAEYATMKSRGTQFWFEPCTKFDSFLNMAFLLYRLKFKLLL